MAPTAAAARPQRIPATALQALLDAAVDAIVIIDVRGNIVAFNAAAERMFGYAESELLGQPVQVLMPEPYIRRCNGHAAPTAQSSRRPRSTSA